MKLSLSQPISEVLDGPGGDEVATIVGEALTASLILPKYGSLYDTASGLKSPAGLARVVVEAMQQGLDRALDKEPTQ
jgi:hypothetical protein